MKLALDYVVVVVDDLERSLAFYVDVLGIELAHRSGSYAQLATGTTRLGLFQREAMADTLGRERIDPPPRDAPAFELGCKVDDVDEVYATLLTAGVPGEVPPTTRPWGQRTAYVRDPDGNLVELAQDL